MREEISRCSSNRSGPFLSYVAGYLQNVQSEFTSKVPVVLAYLPSVGVNCQIGINNTAAVQTSQLLAAYTRLDPRVTKLGVLFKYWAKVRD